MLLASSQGASKIALGLASMFAATQLAMFNAG